MECTIWCRWIIELEKKSSERYSGLYSGVHNVLSCKRDYTECVAWSAGQEVCSHVCVVGGAPPTFQTGVFTIYMYVILITSG